MARSNLARLLSPRSIAVIGGREGEEVIRQCAAIGFNGAVWPVNPRRADMAGLKTYTSIDDLPEAPDASFIAVPPEAALGAVERLARRGAGGAVIYTSGFAETGAEGAALECALIARSGGMALTGPNCYGHINYLDGAALWPDQHGGRRVPRGVAIVTQSGNIGLNLTMQRRSLPLAYLVTVGNKAKGDMADYVDAFLDDPRVTAIGLHIEGLRDVQGFERAALRAREKRVPIVVIKTGRSQTGAAITLSHTASLAGPDKIYSALFARLGVARARDLGEFIEALKLLHVHGPLPGRRISSMSCSGGEASLVADLAGDFGLETPAPDAALARHLSAALGARVAVANPLDYHTYVWGDVSAQTKLFTAMLGGAHDLNLLVLDFPRSYPEGCAAWQDALDALAAARAKTGARAAVLASLPESLSGEVGEALIAKGIAPMQGFSEALAAAALSADIGAAWARAPAAKLTAAHASALPARRLNEHESKAALAAFGLALPAHCVVARADVAAAAAKLGAPVAVKALSRDIAHKSEAGAVALNLAAPDAAQAAADAMTHLAESFLVEEMIGGGVAEIIIGVRAEPPLGLALTIGAGGIFTELLADTATLLLPAGDDDIARALDSLRITAALRGARGRPAADMDALAAAVDAVARYALENRATLLELDVNPLIVRAAGRGAVAADAFIRHAGAPRA